MPRRDVIADAAITTLAAAGMRGLTHRAVDRTAGLPEGSTSYYFRSRQELLQAVVERLIAADAADAPAVAAGDLDELAESFSALIAQWLTEGRERQLARYELVLEATRRPELREALAAARARVRAMLADRLAAAGVPGPQERAYDVAAFLDGLLFDQMVGAGAREFGVDRLRELIRGFLAAVSETG